MKFEIPMEAIEWLANGERGLSSETMFITLSSMGQVREARHYYPHDPGDFIRCEKLLQAVPELRRRLALMGMVSEEWEALCSNWDLIVNAIEDELPGVFTRFKTRHSMPKTYRIMSEILRNARKESKFVQDLRRHIKRKWEVEE